MAEISPMFALDAEELFQAGMFEEAVSLCKSGIDSFPDYFAGYSLLIKTLIELNDLEQASSLLSSAENIFPKNPVISEFKDLIFKRNEIAIPIVDDDPFASFVNSTKDIFEKQESSIALDELSEKKIEITHPFEIAAIEEIAGSNIMAEIEDIINDMPEQESALGDFDARDFTVLPEDNEIDEVKYPPINVEAMGYNDSDSNVRDDDFEELINIFDSLESKHLDLIEELDYDEAADIIGIIDAINRPEEFIGENNYTMLEEVDESIFEENNVLLLDDKNESRFKNSTMTKEPSERPILQSGFLKILASQPSIKNEDESDTIRANDKTILAGLFDYEFYDRSYQADIQFPVELASGFDISSIEKKYTKKAVLNDDFALLAEKIKLIDIKPIEKLDIADDFDYNNSDDDVIEKVAPATETMANIFVLQKAYPKAIQIYEQLLENNPDKSEFYLEKIKNVQAKIDSFEGI